MRLDVLAKDKNGAYLNIEVQRNDKDAVPVRARFNSSLIDANVVEKGTELKDLPETYVIIITENDIWGKGLPLYTVDRIVCETNEIFDDKSHTDITKITKEREDEKGMCKIIDDIAQREQKEERIDTALRMIEKGKYSVEEIAEMSNLSVSEVGELIKKRSA